MIHFIKENAIFFTQKQECVAPLVPSQIQYFLTKISTQILGLIKIHQKMFLPYQIIINCLAVDIKQLQGKNAQNQHYWQFPINEFSNKILLDNNVTHLLQFFFSFSKNVYSRSIITLSKASTFSFWNCPCSFLFKFFDAVLSIMKTTNF